MLPLHPFFHLMLLFQVKQSDNELFFDLQLQAFQPKPHIICLGCPLSRKGTLLQATLPTFILTGCNSCRFQYCLHLFAHFVSVAASYESMESVVSLFPTLFPSQHLGTSEIKSFTPVCTHYLFLMLQHA